MQHQPARPTAAGVTPLTTISRHASARTSPPPTLAPSLVPISSATRCATVTAATRRGCVQATMPPLASPASYTKRGIWVVARRGIEAHVRVLACESFGRGRATHRAPRGSSGAPCGVLGTACVCQNPDLSLRPPAWSCQSPSLQSQSAPGAPSQALPACPSPTTPAAAAARRPAAACKEGREAARVIETFPHAFKSSPARPRPKRRRGRGASVPAFLQRAQHRSPFYSMTAMALAVSPSGPAPAAACHSRDGSRRRSCFSRLAVRFPLVWTPWRHAIQQCKANVSSCSPAAADRPTARSAGRRC